jgi:hypothetical protein
MKTTIQEGIIFISLYAHFISYVDDSMLIIVYIFIDRKFASLIMGSDEIPSIHNHKPHLYRILE